MKVLWMWCFLFCLLPAYSADTVEHHDLATIKSIDTVNSPPYSLEVSDIALSKNYHLKIVDLFNNYFSVITENRARDLFSTLERNPRARMRIAG